MNDDAIIFSCIVMEFSEEGDDGTTPKMGCMSSIKVI